MQISTIKHTFFSFWNFVSRALFFKILSSKSGRFTSFLASTLECWFIFKVQCHPFVSFYLIKKIYWHFIISAKHCLNLNLRCLFFIFREKDSKVVSRLFSALYASFPLIINKHNGVVATWQESKVIVITLEKKLESKILQ